jgi:hypothetical protein
MPKAAHTSGTLYPDAEVAAPRHLDVYIGLCGMEVILGPQVEDEKTMLRAHNAG